MIKAAFFDIDGTLLSFKTHRMPESTKRALVALRAHGVKCYIASGRPKYQFPPCIAEGFEGFGGFDGFVSLTGSLCFDGTGTYFDCPVAPADVATIVAQIESGQYEALVLEEERAYVSAHTPHICEIEQAAGLAYEDGNIRDATRARVYQFCAFVPPEREHEITDACPGVLTTRWSDLFCDVVPAASSKPAGIRATLEHVGLTPEEAIAFGDGGNDETMMQFCGIGVAMGNARPGTKAVADYVTTSVDEDGIWNACHELGLV